MLAVMLLLAASLLVVTPAIAHHDDGKGNISLPTQAEKDHEEANVSGAGYARCIDGMAADTYPCRRVDVLSHLWLDELGLSFANDMWGWTDPKTKRDYALIGGTEGTVFVDISNPRRPDIVGLLPTHSTEGGQFWRDIKVYRNHAFVVSEHTGHGMQVFDLTGLRGVRGAPVTFEETAHYGEFGNATTSTSTPTAASRTRSARPRAVLAGCTWSTSPILTTRTLPVASPTTATSTTPSASSTRDRTARTATTRSASTRTRRTCRTTRCSTRCRSST
jgi:choice-of-anchor B domain-containing protein